jgi:hypothetical protein
MWKLDTEYNKWYKQGDSLTKENFDYLKQSLDKVRFYSKCLSGATYYPVNDLNNIYDIMSSYVPRNWYVSTTYSITSFPSQNPRPITSTSSNEYYNKYVAEYGLTLKNLFTPKRLIDDSISNFIYVDIATTQELENIGQNVIDLVIDDFKVKEGHRVLVKDQKTYVTLSNLIDPDAYFYPIPYYVDPNQPVGSLDTIYYYYNELNGIYKYDGSKLVRESDLDSYEDCIRYSICVKLGTKNKDKQYHLVRMKDGYYPSVSENQPIEFKEKHNWVMRNRVDYNNVLDLNYFDVIKHGTQEYFDIVDNFTYSIPERLIGVGEFGVIINYQNNVSHIINNKYKVNLRSISEVNGYYWICGDQGTLLKVSKVDFSIQKVDIGVLGSLRSVSFFNDVRGVVVGDFNNIYYTDNGGKKWNRILVPEFNAYSYNKVLYYDIDNFFVGGNSGVFLEFKLVLGEWNINRKRVAKYLDDDEYLLVEDINDIISFTSSNWGLTYSYSTQSIPTNKESLMLVTNNGNLIVYNLNGYVDYDFLYLEFNQRYGDINSVSLRKNSNEFYFSSDNIYSFDINNFQVIGSSVSNVIYGLTGATLSYSLYANKIADYNGDEILVSGNNSLLDFASYSYVIDGVMDPTFNQRLKSKLLFLDYDIAAKLNFFDDQQNYRLPNSLTFSGASFVTGSYFVVDELFGEKNWITYWKDREKTFEYYTSMSDANVVYPSTTFSYSGITYSMILSITSSSIHIDYNSILPLAPTIGDDSRSRYVMGTGPSINATSSISTDVYLYKYLMIIKVQSPIIGADVGDVIYLYSSVVEGHFIVNKVISSGANRYYYLYTDFNETILNDLKSLPPTEFIRFVNLNKYGSSPGETAYPIPSIFPPLYDDDSDYVANSAASNFSNKFNLHPISKAFETSFASASNILTISPIFSRESAYYNLGSKVNLSGTTYSMTYRNTFLKFGYKPHYDILSYLENINSNFNSGKEILAMPNYYYVPCVDFPYYSGFSGLTSGNIYLDTNKGFIGGSGSYWLNPSSPPENKLIFGDGLKLEWDSLFINTFVDITLHGASSSYITEKLLIINKYESTFAGQKGYVIEFHKSLNYPLNVNIEYISIVSRRFLWQISEDLKELNNIQRPNSVVKEIQFGYTYSNYESELNFKFPTDSYAKLLLSDSDIVSSLSAIIYTDYKNELAMNITRLDREIEVPIISTTNFATGSNNYLYISCSEKHGLVEGDGVLLEFNGGTGSSQTINPQYFGFHTVGIIPSNEYDFFVYTQFGSASMVSGDPGIVKYVRRDPFLNYQPIDLIDLGVDKKTKIAVDLRPNNTNLEGSIYKLVDVNTKKYKFKLFDGLTLDIISNLYPWLLEAEISDALIGMDANQNLIWYSGIWYCGRWFGSSNGKTATWVSGIWISGDWYGGIWKSNSIEDKLISISINNESNRTNSIWFDGRWYDGTWENGTWYNGRWYDGTWKNGDWFNGIWNDGHWLDGRFIGGIWVLGTWYNGIFNTDNKPSYWIDGNWNGGDFENGIWYNGVWDQKNGKKSRFGVKSYNSRTSTWHAGKWIVGDFHSRLNLNDNGQPDVADDHKLSIWRTGLWLSGNWYGGIAYNIDFRSGNWYGGILDDIQVVGIDTINNTIDVNGVFKFNIGDEISIIDNNIGNTFSIYGSNDNPYTYKVLYQVEDPITNYTTLYVNRDLSNIGTYSLTYSLSGYDLGLRVVSKFKGSNWESGIWTNGIFENGNWNGGIWYNGVFNGTWG